MIELAALVRAGVPAKDAPTLAPAFAEGLLTIQAARERAENDYKRDMLQLLGGRG